MLFLPSAGKLPESGALPGCRWVRMSDHRRSKRVLSNLRHAHCTHFHVVGEENDAALWAESAAQSERCIGQSANPLLGNISDIFLQGNHEGMDTLATSAIAPTASKD